MKSQHKQSWVFFSALLLVCRTAFAINVPPSTQPPGGLPPSNTPQIVLLTFDDSVTTASYARVEQVLDGFTNPNGHAIKATFFVSLDSLYDPLSIRKLYEQGHEIAIHTMSHTTDEYSSWIRWTQEIAGCRRTLATLCAIPETEIVGFRAPFLKPDDHTFRVLHERGFLYDSSFPEGISDLSTSPDNMLWPYTLDNGLAQSAPAARKPLTGYPGLFEVPLCIQFTNSVPVTSMDPPESLSSNAVVALWKENFLAHYDGNRAPYGVFLHATASDQWLSNPAHDAWRIGALRDFIEWAQSFPDTWFVSCSDLAHFMETPVDVAHAATNAPFLTPVRDTFPDEDVTQCPFPNSHTLRVCGPCPPAAPTYVNAYLGAVPMEGGTAWLNIVAQDEAFAWCTLTVSNDVDAVLYDWSVRFSIVGGGVQQLYDANTTQDLGQVIATAKSYNRQIAAREALALTFRVQRSGGPVVFSNIEVAVEGLGPKDIQMSIAKEMPEDVWCLSWSDNAHVYQLEASTNLLSSGEWFPVTNSLVRPEFQISPVYDACFFRILGTVY